MLGEPVRRRTERGIFYIDQQFTATTPVGLNDALASKWYRSRTIERLFQGVAMNLRARNKLRIAARRRLRTLDSVQTAEGRFCHLQNPKRST